MGGEVQSSVDGGQTGRGRITVQDIVQRAIVDRLSTLTVLEFGVPKLSKNFHFVVNG